MSSSGQERASTRRPLGDEKTNGSVREITMNVPNRRHAVLLLILFMLSATALQAQRGGETAIRSRPRAKIMLSSTLQFYGSYSYSFGGGTALMKADTVQNSSASPTGPLRFALLMATSPYPAAGFTTATYAFGPIAANTSISNVNSGNVPFTVPPTGCYNITLVLQEQVSGN